MHDLLPKGFWVDTVDSTQAEAKRLIASGQIEGSAFVLARAQTAGRGTQGREWLSPEGKGIYLSLIYQPVDGQSITLSADYTLAAGVASVETLKALLDLEASLKPVNDVYLAGRKLAGILVESEVRQSGMSYLITGVGLNTHRANRPLPEGHTCPISIEETLEPADFARVDWDLLIEHLVAKLSFWQGLVMAGQTGQVRRAWESHCMPEFTAAFPWQGESGYNG